MELSIFPQIRGSVNLVIYFRWRQSTSFCLHGSVFTSLTKLMTKHISCIVFHNFHQCWQILSYTPLSNPWDRKEKNNNNNTCCQSISCIGVHITVGERGGSVVECWTPEREVRGSIPTAAVLCPWARHFTPRKYWLITQEAVAPSRHDWKIVDWDVKPQHKQT